MNEFNVDDISTRQQASPILRKITGRHRRWILPAAAGAALLAAAAPQLASEDELPAIATVQVSEAPALHAALPVHRVTTVRIMPREKPAALVAVAKEAAAEADKAVDTAGLGQADPRWAREVTQPNPRQLPRTEAEPAKLENASSAGAIAGARSLRAVEDDKRAPSRIGNSEPIVPGGETLDTMQTASLSAPDAADRRAAIIDPEPAADQPEPKEAAARTRSRVTTHVNMRSGPGGKILMVVPADAVVEVIGCDSWCEISYDGRTGFVFKQFVNAAGTKAVPKPAKTTGAKAAKRTKTKKAASVKQAANTIAAGKTAAGKLPEALTPDTAETAAGQHNAFGLTCGFMRQCTTYGAEKAAAPPAN